MALRRDLTYDGRYQAATDEQPQGAFKNRTSNTSEDGSYLAAGWLNDWSALFSSMLVNAGITPNNVIDEVGASQYYDALQALIRAERVGDRLELHSVHVPPYVVHADGQELSRTTDDLLWEFAKNSGLLVAQTTKDSDKVAYAMYWGDGDGSTSFTIPNWHLGHFPRGNPTGVNIGDVQGDAIRNFTGKISNVVQAGTEDYTPTNEAGGVFEPNFIDVEMKLPKMTETTFRGTAGIYLDASKVVPTADENRPKAGNILVCLHRGKI